MPLGEEVVRQVYEFFGVQTLEPRRAGDHVGDDIVEAMRPGRHMELLVQYLYRRRLNAIKPHSN